MNKERRWVRVSGKAPLQHGGIRIIGKQSTLEIAFSREESDSSETMWLPLPPMLNRLCADAVRSIPADKPLLSDKRWLQWQDMVSPGKARFSTAHDAFSNQLSAYPAMHLRTWRHYIRKCAMSDAALNPLARAWLTGLSGIGERAGHHYQQLDSDVLRYDLFQAINKYLIRLQSALPNKLKFLIVEDSYVWLGLLQADNIAAYLTETPGRIPERKLQEGNHVGMWIARYCLTAVSGHFLNRMSSQHSKQCGENAISFGLPVGQIKPNGLRITTL